MRSIKNHLGFILPLVALLFAVQFSILADNILSEYKNLMSKDYNIVIVSSKKLTIDDLKSSIKEALALDEIDNDKIISKLNGEISSKNLGLLKNALPNFYSLKLNSFVNSKRLEGIRANLLKIDGVTQAETFLKTHDKIYKALELSRLLSLAFVVIIGAIGFLLILKQIRIWLYEHRERMQIMTLFGAGFILKSGILYRTAIVDSIMASLFVVASFYFAPEISSLKQILLELDLSMPKIDLVSDGLRLLGYSLGISIISVSLVMKTYRRTNDEV
ncbi:cell division protein FtsX [Campylobacter sp. 19-13652]|uniref:cell division protein FtsX n=1 Tax=Campylobacter sp. 19-13652 TaxID=2840180 RepID=UPI001C74BCDB|nr:cell division protein FtsX [Campylobacter sp. 19-13652]BCX79748.1 cell division protein FtsX [Campylobacter sp. 19-13652]